MKSNPYMTNHHLHILNLIVPELLALNTPILMSSFKKNPPEERVLHLIRILNSGLKKFNCISAPFNTSVLLEECFHVLLNNYYTQTANQSEQELFDVYTNYKIPLLSHKFNSPGIVSTLNDGKTA